MAFPFTRPAVRPRLLVQIRLWTALLIVGTTLYVLNTNPELPPLAGLPIFLAAVLMYSEFCPSCGLLSWARGPEVKDNILTAGPFWIARRCRSCGSE